METIVEFRIKPGGKAIANGEIGVSDDGTFYMRGFRLEGGEKITCKITEAKAGSNDPQA